MDGTSAFIRKNDKFKLAEAFMNNIRISSQNKTFPGRQSHARAGSNSTFHEVERPSASLFQHNLSCQSMLTFHLQCSDSFLKLFDFNKI